MRIASNLALDERVNALRAQGVDVLHLGFGEAGLPVHPGLVDALVRGAQRNAYGPVAGGAAARESVAGYWTRRGTPTSADQVVLAPGSKPLLAAVVACEPGDVVLPRPSWVTYASQVEIFGRRPVWVDVPAGSGGIPDPALLPEALARARAQGADPRLVVATLPDNPTGLLARPEEVKELCRVAEAEDLVVVSDEIYRDVVFGSVPFVSPADLVPERTITVTGLSKSLALGGWRVGADPLPRHGVGAGAARPASSASPARCGPTWPDRCSRSPSTRSTSRPTWCATGRPPPACTARSPARCTRSSPGTACSTCRPTAPSTSTPTSSRTGSVWRRTASGVGPT